MIPLPPSQLGSSPHSGPPSDPAIEIPMSSRNKNPFINPLMVVPPANIPHPTLEEAHVSMSSRKDKLPGTIETNVMPTNAATSHFTPKMSGRWSLIPLSVIPW